jgi:hypothetical protein
MKQLCLGVVIAAGLTFPAFANPPRLKGDYIFTFSQICLVSPSGFSANAALGQTYSTTDMEHFNDDGRPGTVKGTGESINLGSPPLPANATQLRVTHPSACHVHARLVAL